MSDALVRDLLRAQILQVWGQRRLDLLPQMYAEDVVDHNPVPGQVPGLAGMRLAVDTLHDAFPDLTMELHGTVVDGDRGVDWWTFRGTHTGPLGGLAPTGRPVVFSGSDVVRVRDGRIAEIWHVEDLLGMALQLAGPDPVAALEALA